MDKYPIALKKSLAVSTLSLAITALGSSPAHAYSFDIGEVDGSINSTISVGASWRLAKPMKGTLPIVEGGSLMASNYDNGNLNFKRGETFSRIFKGIHDLELRYKNFGAFFRGRYWYDAELKDRQDQRRYRIPDEALDDSGAGAELLDAFVWANFDLPIGEEGMPANLRYGRQVISWGESTFIQNSINTINPVDVSAFHKPGAQIKEALLPVEMIFGSIGLTDELSFEAFYQIKWDHTRVDSCHTYFALIDYLPPGCNSLNASFGTLSHEQVQANVAIPLIPGLPLPISTNLEKKAVYKPSDSGQFGLAFRYYAESLNDTEFGLYFINYHARRPLVGAYGADPAVAASTAPNGYLNLGTGYFVEYVEDIRLYGFSFNTTLGDTAVSGELSFRPNQHIQKSFAPVIWAAIDPLSPLLQSFNVLPPDVRLGDFSAYESVSTGERFDPGKRFPVLQGQMTLIQFFDQVLGGERLTLIGEAGFVKVNGAPKNHIYPLFGPTGGDLPVPASSYNTTQSAALGGATVSVCGFVVPAEACSTNGTGDGFSWGYRLLAIFEYGDVFNGIKLTPSLFYTHDVNGSTPFPVANFEEDVKSLGLSLKADYLNTYEVTISYTNFFDGDLHLYRDRDYASLSMSYNF